MFKPRPYDPDRPNKQTSAQRAATDRNFAIFKLHGLWAQAGMLNEPIRSTVRALIDADLKDRGAKTRTERDRELVAKALKRRQREEAKRVCTDCGHPFLECECIPF